MKKIIILMLICFLCGCQAEVSETSAVETPETEETIKEEVKTDNETEINTINKVSDNNVVEVEETTTSREPIYYNIDRPVYRDMAFEPEPEGGYIEFNFDDFIKLDNTDDRFEYLVRAYGNTGSMFPKILVGDLHIWDEWYYYSLDVFANEGEIDEQLYNWLHEAPYEVAAIGAHS